MNPDFLLAIISMDSYNRGYGGGIKDLPVDLQITKIGNATIVRQSDILPNSDGVAAGFYAIAYDMTGVAGFSAGQTVIAYRGTDAKLVDPFGDEGGDLINGYALALGDYAAPQARLALRAVCG